MYFDAQFILTLTLQATLTDIVLILTWFFPILLIQNQYLTVTYQYLANAYLVKAAFNWSWSIFKQ